MELTEAQINHLTEYVYSKYSSMKGKKLYIQTLGASAIGISDNKDGSPLILSRGVLSDVV